MLRDIDRARHVHPGQHAVILFSVLDPGAAFLSFAEQLVFCKNSERGGTLSYIVGIVCFKDESAYRRSRGFMPNSQARTAFAEHVVLEYEKTGKGTVIE